VSTVARIVIELAEDRVRSPEAQVLLAAAMTSFDADAEVVLCLTDIEHPTESHAGEVLAACGDALPSGAVMPTIDLLGPTVAAESPHLLYVKLGHSGFDCARAVVRLGALAAARRTDLMDETARTAPPEPSPGPIRAAVTGRIRVRDAERLDVGPGWRPLVVAVVQVQSYWPALASICEALEGADDVQLEVVALESEHDARAQRTDEFVRAAGYRPRDPAWFAAQLADRSGPLALVLLDHPYDAMRPDALRSTAIADAGVRLVYSPYTNNNLGGGTDVPGAHHDVRMQYDLPLHRLAWRIYVRSAAQAQLHASHCAAGGDNVRVSGMPKLDRLVRASRTPPGAGSSPVLEKAAGRPVVLWNPHFSFGPGGWSTFDRYVDDMVAWFEAHDDVVLLLRPHFRIWRDLRLQNGGQPHIVERRVRAAARRRDNILLDEDPDYLPAFLASDAMVSDLSSLITEYVPLGRPVLYLHRDDGPGVNEDAAYFFKLDVAVRWEHVVSFLAQIRLRADGGAGRRECLLRDHFGALDGRVGERIAADLVHELRGEQEKVAR
jgi:hypothetical protein